ncbi:Putative glycosyltransferase (fragment) [Xenorhabdus nematophila F1]
MLIDKNKILSQYSDPHKTYIEVIMPIKAQFYLDHIRQKSLFLGIKIIFKKIYKILFR